MIGAAELSQLHWSHPYGWLLALQPLVMAAATGLRRRSIGRYADRQLLPWAVWQGVRGGGVGRRALNMLAWMLLACAAAGPRQAIDAGAYSAGPVPAAHVADVMVVLDVTRDNAPQDGQPDALERARIELLDLPAKLHGERLGLIVYAHGAGLLMPLNRDYHAFRYYLGLARPSLFQGAGSDLAGALTLAGRKLQGDASRSKAVVLVTAGEPAALAGTSGARLPGAVAALRSAHIPLYVLDNGGAGSSFAVLQRYARLTGGKLARGGNGRDAWQVLYHNGIRALPGAATVRSGPGAWKPLYSWVLAPALALLWILYLPVGLASRGAGAATLLLCASLSVGIAIPRPAAAADATASQAYAAYRKHQFALAQAIYAQLQGYAARMGEGASAYRLEAYPYAMRQFTAALLQARNDHQRADALFDIGNSAYLAGRYRAAADAYLGVLRYRRDARARTNLGLAARQLGGLVRTDKYTLGILALRGQRGGHQPGDGSGGGAPSAPGKQNDATPLAASRPSSGDYAHAHPTGKGGASPAQPFDEDANAIQFYRAALKKLELIHGRAERLQKALLGMDAADNAGDDPQGGTR